jgi:hypothetical protein
MKSICPFCKKYGIPAFEKIKKGKFQRRRLRTVSCSYCHKKFIINLPRYIGISLLIICAVSLGSIYIKKYVFSYPDWVSIILGVVLILLLEYFAPLKEVDE